MKEETTHGTREDFFVALKCLALRGSAVIRKSIGNCKRQHWAPDPIDPSGGRCIWRTGCDFAR